MSVGVGEQSGDRGDRRFARGVIRSDDEGIGMEVEEDLSASSARSQQPTALVADRGDRDERTGVRGRGGADRDEFRAGSTVEVVDVDTGVDSPDSVHGGSGNGVVFIRPEAAYEFFSGGDYAQL